LRYENESGETILPENLKLINHLNIKMNKFKSQSNLKPERLNQSGTMPRTEITATFQAAIEK
jgi:hypothetical protein